MLLGVTNGNFRDIKRYFLSFMRYPPSSVFQFLKFISVTKTRLKKVLCPALVLQSKNDDTVRRKSAEYIFTELGSDDKNLKYYETGGHVILVITSYSIHYTKLYDTLQQIPFLLMYPC